MEDRELRKLVDAINTLGTSFIMGCALLGLLTMCAHTMH